MNTLRPLSVLLLLPTALAMADAPASLPSSDGAAPLAPESDLAAEGSRGGRAGCVRIHLAPPQVLVGCTGVVRLALP